MVEDFVIEQFDGSDWVILYYYTGTFRDAIDHISKQPQPQFLRARKKREVLR